MSSSSNALRQSRLQRQSPRRATHVHRLRSARNDPVLAHRIPVRDIAAGDLSLEGLLLTCFDRDIIESAEDDLWIVGTTERDVL
jgi:hypothetical protein